MFKIDQITIDRNTSPLVIPEIGACHDGSVQKAIKMIDEIKKAGARCVKFQLYSPQELVADQNRIIEWGPPNGKRVKEKVGDMFKRLSITKNELKYLFEHSRFQGLVPFATPFSMQGVDNLMDLDVACFKIAASDVDHLPLLRYIAKTGKPIILSLGKCTLAEADEAISVLLEEGCAQLSILHCVSTYPSPMDEMNLNVIPALIKLYPECIVGFSDHSIGIVAPLAATALGAKIIEKHVTIDKKDIGPDHWFSLEMNELKHLIEGVESVHSALGHPRKQVLACEHQGRAKATRSLVANCAITKGTIITEKHLKIVRPGYGIEPKHLSTVIGMKPQRDVEENEVLVWDIFRGTL